MDGRDGMALSGPSSYYIHHRGLAGSSPGTPSGLHGPPGMRSLPNPNTSMPLQSSNIGGGGSIGSSFQVESPSPLSQQHGISPGGGQGQGGGGVYQGETGKRKRGRPRKYGPDGTVSLGLSTMSSTTPTPASGSGVGSGSISGSGSAASTQKRGRGRPPGTGRKQQLASFGEWISSSAGMGFTPHVITITVGEDIASKIMAFSQQGPRGVCILSANGAVSTVTLRQPATSGGTVTYEGRFEILCLSGSYLLTDSGGSRSRSGGLSISLASPDGRVIGGGVGGLLTAASPVQVVVGSFNYGGSKAKNKSRGGGGESGGELDVPLGDSQMTPSSPPHSQNLNPLLSGWPALRQMDMRNAHLEIDLTRG